MHLKSDATLLAHFDCSFLYLVHDAMQAELQPNLAPCLASVQCMVAECRSHLGLKIAPKTGLVSKPWPCQQNLALSANPGSCTMPGSCIRSDVLSNHLKYVDPSQRVFNTQLCYSAKDLLWWRTHDYPA